MAIIIDSDLPKIYTSVDVDGNNAGSWFYFNGQTNFDEACQHGTNQIITELKKNKKLVFKEDPADLGNYKYFTATEADLLDIESIKEIAVDFAVAFILKQNWLTSGGDTDSAMYLTMIERETTANDKMALIPFGFDSNGDGVLDEEERHNTNLAVHRVSR